MNFGHIFYVSYFMNPGHVWASVLKIFRVTELSYSIFKNVQKI